MLHYSNSRVFFRMDIKKYSRYYIYLKFTIYFKRRRLKWQK